MGLDFMKDWASMQNNFKNIPDKKRIEIEKKLGELEEAGKIGKDQKGDVFDVINKNDKKIYKDLKKDESLSNYDEVEKNLEKLSDKIEKEMEAEFTERRAGKNPSENETQINKIKKIKGEIIQLKTELEMMKKEKADNSFMLLMNKKLEIMKKEDELQNLIQSN